MLKKPKQKQIESFLQQIPDFNGFQKSKWSLEQYMTPPSMAAQIINQVLLQQESLEGLLAADFGCGTGMLSAAMICAGVQQLKIQANNIKFFIREVVGYEIDTQAAHIAKQTLSDIHNDDQFDIVVTDIKHHSFYSKNKIFDLIIMNPPFGTKDEPDELLGGIDTVFLRNAFNQCNGDVYSLHKSSTREYLKKFCEHSGRKFQLLQEIKFPLPKKFNSYHKKQIAYTEVDLIRFIYE